METIDNLTQNTQPLEITENSREYLKTAASWTRFLAIFSFVAIIFLALVGIIMLTAGNFIEEVSNKVGNDVPFHGFFRFMGMIYIVLSIVVIFPTLYLFRFSKKTVTALENQDTFVMETAFKNMKSYWKFSGIMAIVALALIPVTFIVSIVAAVMNAM